MSSKFTYKSHIKTGSSVVIIVDGGPPMTVSSKSPSYKTIIKHLTQAQYDKAIELADVKASVAAKAKAKRIDLQVQGDRVVIEGASLPAALSQRLIQFQEKGIDYDPLLKFWNNLKSNPREDSKEDLYAFLEANHVPLTEDGCFIGYKYVTKEFKDERTKTFDNTPGKVVEMPREKVDPNRNNTCSSGLHVAAYSYAATQRPADCVVVEVKVNPADVVTVPPDYNQQKMRVCKYEVVRQLGIDQGEEKEEVYDAVKREKESRIDPVSGKAKTKAKKAEAEFELVKFDKSGRFRISKLLLQKIGQGAKLSVYKNTKSPGLLLTLATSIPATIEVLATYSVDKKDGTVRISKTVLEKAGYSLEREYRIKADNELELKIYPAR